MATTQTRGTATKKKARKKKAAKKPAAAKRRNGAAQKANGEVQPGELVQGVKLALADPAQLDASLAALGLDAGGDVRERVERLAKYFLSRKPSDGSNEYDQCEKCSGSQDQALTQPLLGEVCVYCGDGPGGDVETEGAETEAAAPTGEPAVVPEQAIAPEGSALVEGTEAELDDACAKVGKYVQSAVKAFWHIGQQIALIHQKRLWQHRLGPDNQPLYTSFEGFMRGEMNMSDDQAYRYMRTYQAFSEDDAKAIGHSKLDLVLKLPPGPMRDKLKEMAKAGASRREMERAAKADAGGGETTTGPTAPPGPEKVTLALALTSAKLPMTKRRRSNAKGDPQPAMSITDDAEAFEELPNGVVRHYRLSQKRNGQLQLTVETRRV